MFRVGAKYEFRMIEGGDETTFWGEVETYDHPLIKLKDSQPVSVQITTPDGSSIVDLNEAKGHPGKVINVTSPNFISAVEQIR